MFLKEENIIKTQKIDFWVLEVLIVKKFKVKESNQ